MRLTVDDVRQLMEGMSTNRLGMLEWGPLKLVAAPPDRSSSMAAASNVSAPLTADQALKATQAARMEAARLAQLQQETRLARQKAAAGGIGTHTGKLIDDVYKEAVKPQRKRAPNS